MPTSKYFSQCLDFPSGSEVPLANIPTVSFTKLQAGDSDESWTLYEACREQGFFLLDLRVSPEGETILQDGEKMFDLIGTTLNLDRDILAKYACDAPRDLTGFVHFPECH